MFRIGIGSDIHRLVPERPLIIGGVTIESELGADGHSDADVLLHAITDAIFGALAAGDIGTHFPNADPRWQNAESSVFLGYAAGMMRDNGYSIANIDSVINLEAPKLRPHIDTMRENIARVLDLEMTAVSVKAKTGEKVDAVGESRAICARAVVLLVKA